MKTAKRGINWDASPAEHKIIMQIAKRADAYAARAGIIYLPEDAAMDLTACHLNDCPLDLEGLASATDLHFGHDVLGIRRNLNRTTGKLTNFFLPRYAKPEGMTVSFQGVGRDKKSWTAELRNVSDETLIQQIRQHKALGSRVIEFEWRTPQLAAVYVGGRCVGQIEVTGGGKVL